MTIVTEGLYPSEFVLSEANGHRSRDAVTVDQSQTIAPADVLGQKTVGALSAVGAVAAGATGTGTITASPTVAAGTPAGVYRGVCIAAAANAGKFRFEGPDGVEIGEATVAVAASIGGLGFTIADGGTDWVVGDEVTITVSAAAGDGEWVKFNPAATDGSQHAKAIAYAGAVTGAGATAELVVIARDAEVKSALLGWNGATDNQKAAALAELATLGIVARV